LSVASSATRSGTAAQPSRSTESEPAHAAAVAASQGSPERWYSTRNVAAKTTAGELVAALGFDVVDAGPLAQARTLEPLAMLWVSLAVHRGLGPNIAFRLMRRG